jgi:hypothetical protein
MTKLPASKTAKTQRITQKVAMMVPPKETLMRLLVSKSFNIILGKEMMPWHILKKLLTVVWQEAYTMIEYMNNHSCDWG